MIRRPVLAPGTRVRLRAPSHVLTLRSDRGTIVAPDEDLDCYVVRLDIPARCDHGDGHIEDLSEIIEDIDNMDVLESPPR